MSKWTEEDLNQQALQDAYEFGAKEAEYFGDKMPSFRQGMTKSTIAELASASVNLAIEDGDVLKIAEAVSAMAEFVELVRKDDRFINAVVEEANKNKGKLDLPGGAKIEACETGTTYNYSLTPEWVELKNQEKEISDKRKALEEKLKKIPAGKLLVDEATGETLCGPSKTSKSNYKLSLPR
jgi:hypothetical protein